MAVYKQKLCGDYHLLVLENDDGFADYFNDGNRYYEFSAKSHREPQPDDIVSKWEEPIDNKELNKLAYDYCPEERTWATINGYKERDAFKAGYRKAKEK